MQAVLSVKRQQNSAKGLKTCVSSYGHSTSDFALRWCTGFSRLKPVHQQYRVIVPGDNGYTMETESVGISYHVLLCEYIAGDVERVVDREADIVSAIMEVYQLVI